MGAAMATVESVLGAEALRGFDRRGPVLTGLPAAAYTSESFYRLECERLFARAWTFVGFAHELATPGDVVPVSVGRSPVLLTRNGEGAINAFHNVCRHRCTVLVEKPANVGKAMRCPYHSWVYDLDGRLRSAPYFGGPDKRLPDGFRREDHGLRPIRVAVLHDWIFVNLDGKAPEFEEYAAPLMRGLEGIAPERLRTIGTIDLGEVRINWKFLMENFMEPYHVQFVHTTTTNQPLLDHSTFVDGPCIGCRVDLPEADGAAVAPAGVDSLDVSSRYLTLFPNFVLGWYAPDQVGVHLNVPLGPDRTTQRRVLYYGGEGELAAPYVEGLKKLWTKVHLEDHEICERLQRGRCSAVADEGGLLSPHWENGVRAFQELVIAAVRD